MCVCMCVDSLRLALAPDPPPVSQVLGLQIRTTLPGLSTAGDRACQASSPSAESLLQPSLLLFGSVIPRGFCADSKFSLAVDDIM